VRGKDREVGRASAKQPYRLASQPCCPEGPSRSEAEWSPSLAGVQKRRAAKRTRAFGFVLQSGNWNRKSRLVSYGYRKGWKSAHNGHSRGV
jgi:hypothetical protein